MNNRQGTGARESLLYGGKKINEDSKKTKHSVNCKCVHIFLAQFAIFHFFQEVNGS